MEIEKSNHKNNNENNHNNKEFISQKLDSELKRFKSHKVYLVTEKNPKNQNKNGNSSKDHKKIIINISQGGKIKPKTKKSFNNINSNIKKSKHKLINNTEFLFDETKQLIKTPKTVFNKSKTKVSMSTNIKNKDKLTVNNYINSVNKKKDKINTNKILNEESIQEIDSEDNNYNIININKKKEITNISQTNEIYFNNSIGNYCNKAKEININNKNNYTNNINMNLTNNYYIENNGKNKLIKKINFDELYNSSQNTNDINLNNTLTKDNSKNRELLIISKKGDKEKLLGLLSENDININFQNENGWSALHFACDEGNLKIVDILIKSKIDLNLKTNEKKTALHISVLRGYFDISKLLIENGASINIRDNEKNLPIHICALQGHDELLNFILEKNSNGIKVKNLFGKTPLDLANKETTKEIINKFLNLKKNNIVRITDKDKNNNSPKLKNGNNIDYNYGQLNNNKNQFSRIKIHKTNKNQIKSLLTPISSNLNNSNNSNNNEHTNINLNIDTNNEIKSNNSKYFKVNKVKMNTNNNQHINYNENISKNISLNTFNTYNSQNTTSIQNSNNMNNNNNNINKISPKIYQNTAIKKISSTTNQEIKTKNINNISNNNNTNNNANPNPNNNYKIISNNSKYLNNTSNKRKGIFNIHISPNNNNSNNNVNTSNSPSKDSIMRYNTSSNMTSSNKKISSTSNNVKINEFPAGNDIFFGNDKDKIHGKIINIPKKINNRKQNKSQSKKKKFSSIWKTINQTDRITPKFSPNIKCIGKQKKNTALFKKEDSKLILNNLSSKRTVSVPRFLDTEYILEKPLNKKGFKREESIKKKFKVPKKNNNNNTNNNNSNDNINNKNKEINNNKGKYINTNMKNMKKQNSNKNDNNTKNNNSNTIELKNRQIYTDEGADLIDDLEEETIIEINKDKDKLNKNKSKEIKNSNNYINNYNNTNGNIKKGQALESDDEFDDIEELEDSFDASEDSEANKGEKIGPSNFVCLALLGQGSFGEVFLVKKKDSDDFYAMKVLDKCRIAKQNIFKYVLTERNVLSVMHNPFIVKLNYAFQTSEKLFLLLDYCPGGDLSKQLQIQTRFSEEKAKFYICEIILALGDLHKNNIIFRDLKPDNVVIDKDGHALLTDFGLSREGVIGKEIAKSFCGSIAYLAPEMLNRSGHGKAVDWYLLGVLFYELLVGVPPYFTGNQEQIFRNIQKAELYIPPFVSQKAQKLIKSLLKRNPNERLGSKRDVEEIKENEYFSDVDWQKVYERKYKPPQIYLKSNHLQFFRQPVQFKENEEDDLFIKDNNGEYNKYNQDLDSMNNYEGWSFVQKNNGHKENK